MSWTEIFTNKWFEYAWSNYSYFIGSVYALLKSWAIMHPGTPNNKILDLLQTLIFKQK